MMLMVEEVVKVVVEGVEVVEVEEEVKVVVEVVVITCKALVSLPVWKSSSLHLISLTTFNNVVSVISG